MPENHIHLFPPLPDTAPIAPANARIDLLSVAATDALARLIGIIFPSQGGLRIRYDARAMWCEIPGSTVANIFRDACDFLGAVSPLNEWLSTWSLSADRQPNLSPAWAAERGIDCECVRRLADAFADSLAQPHHLYVRMYGQDGREYTLRIPPREALRPPEAASAQESLNIQVDRVEQVPWLQDPFGRHILLQGTAAALERVIKSGFYRVSRKQLRRMTLIEAKRLMASDDPSASIPSGDQS